MNYTPAPWIPHVVNYINDTPAQWEIRDRHRGVIAITESVNPDDAALIAAAPDLLAACIGFQSAWNENRLLTSDEAAAINAAINKATHL
jgi:hypothetical protein